jgi:predicted RNase H-like HicB family nuclease
MKNYIAFFEYDKKNSSYGVVFPDLPGLTSGGGTYDEAVRNAHEALSLYLDGEDDVPKPRTLEQIKSGWDDWKEWENNYDFIVGKVDFLPLKPKIKRFNISIDERLVGRIDRATNNRSGFITEAIERMLANGKTYKHSSFTTC